MPSLIASCCDVFILYHWEDSYFLNGNGGAVDMG